MDEDLSVEMESHIVLDNHRTLWLTEISRATFEDQALDDVGGDGGMFVVLEDTAEGSFEVLAKAVSSWAGEALLDMFAAAMANKPRLRLVS